MNTRFLFCGLTAASLLTPGSVSMVSTQGAHQSGHSSIIGPLPEAVRNATERYRDVNDAITDGYVQFQGCVSGPDRGAMGVHYSKFSLFDGAVDVNTPEALVYEPKNGKLQLVAAEYVMVYSGDMGNSLGPKGPSIGSSLPDSSSKYPSPYSMKLTSQMCSAVCLTPTVYPAKT